MQLVSSPKLLSRHHGPFRREIDFPLRKGRKQEARLFMYQTLASFGLLDQLMHPKFVRPSVWLPSQSTLILPTRPIAFIAPIQPLFPMIILSGRVLFLSQT